MLPIKKRLFTLKKRISDTAYLRHRNPREITLVAVSKYQPIKMILKAVEAGQLEFGENHVQEAIPKIQALKGLPITWHFIGKLQKNKTRHVAENFSWVHTVDRLAIAERLSIQRPKHLPPLNVCIQINFQKEKQKGGIEPKDLSFFAKSISELPNLNLRGLMCIPKPQINPEQQRLVFKNLRELLIMLNSSGLQCDTLSMGMSQDFVIAIEEGATMLRIGTALFGERD